MNDQAYAIVQAGGDINEALALAQKATLRVPDLASAADPVGWIYVKKHLTDSALQTFRTLTDKYPEHPDLRYHFGMALIQNGKSKEARAQHALALAMLPPPEVRRDVDKALAKTDKIPRSATKIARLSPCSPKPRANGGSGSGS